jgi:hypothetical protein
MNAREQAASDAGKLPVPETGSFCYMLSQEGYTGDRAAGPWYPHMMFFQPTTPAAEWGANLDGVNVVANSSSYRGVTFFLVLVPQWSNGASWDSAHK